ncbi:DUF4838 domain-containing protein [Flavobacterium sp. TAB 87]|uniref:DUF4838 domain-containing protein n=1 Tax=Flavobacterium sp. TAB 87 TaxID=1729581 RepID=UPI00076DCE0B|nr:DUF4838 domain-containing protein [Flavobacterium sp. TAB 87]KVV15538.1 hypothetical protein AP058_00822 [Flavobacterium sp. TAB 87]
MKLSQFKTPQIQFSLVTQSPMHQRHNSTDYELTLSVQYKSLNMQKSILVLLLFMAVNVQLMAQSDIIFKESIAQIGYSDEKCSSAAKLLQENLNKISNVIFDINQKSKNNGIQLKITSNKKDNYYEIISDQKQIKIIANSPLYLEYAVTTLLEIWNIKKLTPNFTYYPEKKVLHYPIDKIIREQPSFNFRAILFPGAYDQAFRKWHKLDWSVGDFGLWGHTFSQLIPKNHYFKENPKMFALYNHERNSGSICYSNDTVFKVLKENLKRSIAENPEATYFSVSINDDVINCECTDCKKLNAKYGSPQGAHYYFLNQIAKEFSNTKIVSLAYLFTHQPPKNLKLKSNLYPMFCPIEANRAEALDQGRNKNIASTLTNWTALSKNVIVWDYTVEFSNYLSPFPNFQTFDANYNLFKSNNVHGVFAQGYADIPGSFSELRQYILAKLLWNTSATVTEITADFLNGYYGKAAPFIQEYLNLLEENQIQSNSYLDIYADPVAARHTFLSPKNRNNYEDLLIKANNSTNDEVVQKRILKLKLDLDYVFFEQAKFYGKEQYGMYEKIGNKFIVVPNLQQRVVDFTKYCNEFGIYELSEGGLSPDAYLQDWLFIANNNVVDHLGEHTKMSFLTQPSYEYSAKKEKGLQDGIKGYKDFTINWTGWYGENVEVEIDRSSRDFNSIEFQCLEDQRHWIFLPAKVQVLGFSENKWTLIDEVMVQPIAENYMVNLQKYTFNSNELKKYEKLKLIAVQQPKVPAWRERKTKKPMIMIDEIILNKI